MPGSNETKKDEADAAECEKCDFYFCRFCFKNSHFGKPCPSADCKYYFSVIDLFVIVVLLSLSSLDRLVNLAGINPSIERGEFFFFQNDQGSHYGR